MLKDFPVLFCLQIPSNANHENSETNRNGSTYRIRGKQNITQEEFGKLFHVTRQTVSNWENEKSYPDLQTLVTISDLFEISLDILLKGDHKMIARIDYERMYGSIKKRLSIINFFTGSGTGLLFSGLFARKPSTGAVCWYREKTGISAAIWKTEALMSWRKSGF